MLALIADYALVIRRMYGSCRASRSATSVRPSSRCPPFRWRIPANPDGGSRVSRRPGSGAA